MACGAGEFASAGVVDELNKLVKFASPELANAAQMGGLRFGPITSRSAWEGCIV